MSRPRRYIPRDSSRRRLWIYVALLAFLVADVVLISWAFGARNANAPTATPSSISTLTPGTITTPTPTASLATVAVSPTRVLSALDDNTAWRATTGECPVTPAAPELTTDGGQTWRSTDATGDVKVTAVRELTVVSNTQLEFVGLAAADCSPQFVRSFVAGEEYSTNLELLADQWYLDPSSSAFVHTPNGDVDAPCSAVIEVASRVDDDNSAGIACADSNIYLTTDAGVTWSGPIKGDGIVGLAATTVGYVLATVGSPDCAGVQVATLGGDPIERSSRGCLQIDSQADNVRGDVAVSQGADTLWMWAGETIYQSKDNGVTWQ